jgi:internalin A
VVFFSDDYFDAIIRDEIGKSEGEDIYQSDLEVIDRLSLILFHQIDLSGLEYCTNLTRLTMVDASYVNMDIDLAPLSGLRNLEYLSIEYIPVYDLTSLSGLSKLAYLNINKCETGDLTPLENLRELNTLILHDHFNEVDLESISELENLAELYFEGYIISDSSALTNLDKLKQLTLRYCDVDEISDLSELKGLSYLDLSGNNITDLNPLTNLTELEQVFLSWNEIEDVSPLVNNEGLGSGDIVNLRDNPLSDETVDRHMQTLYNRGVDVRY